MYGCTARYPNGYARSNRDAHADSNACSSDKTPRDASSKLHTGNANLDADSPTYRHAGSHPAADEYAKAAPRDPVGRR